MIGASDPTFRRVKSEIMAALAKLFERTEGVQIDNDVAGELPNEIIRIQHIPRANEQQFRAICKQHTEWGPYIENIHYGAGTLCIELITCDILAWQRKRQKIIVTIELTLVSILLVFCYWLLCIRNGRSCQIC